MEFMFMAQSIYTMFFNQPYRPIGGHKNPVPGWPVRLGQKEFQERDESGI